MAPVDVRDRYPRLGPLERLDKIIQEIRPDRIVVAMTERRGRLPLEALLECRAQGIVIEDGIELYERLTGQLALESMTPGNVIFSRGFRTSRVARFAARALSLAAAAAGLIVLTPLLLLIALAIKFESRGPVLFLQERVGAGGHCFKLIKFRTMLPALGWTSEWVRDNADRITGVGRLLRRYRLDELPQFVNILRGDMNLVGPRPHPASNRQLFADEIPYYRLRSMVRPGVTGWAQIRYGYANDLAEEIEKMRYDLYYVKHMSLALDLRILLDTVKVVLLGRVSRAPEIGRIETGVTRPTDELRAA